MAEQTLGHEIMRLSKLTRESHGEALLAGALAGRERTVDNVVKLFGFITKYHGQDSGVADKFWTVVGSFLEEAGLTSQQLHEIRRPYLVYGEPGFKSILDEMREEGHEI